MSHDPLGFDPRMFILGPFGACPRCGREEYGTLYIQNNRHVRRCRACWHTMSALLPPVRKKLVYLDQMVLSNMAKELDPEWRARTRRPDPFWAELYDQVERLIKLQGLACPESPIHEKEASYDDRVEGVLGRLRRHLAADVSFDFPERIRGQQLGVALEAYIAGVEPDWSALRREDVTHGGLDQWSDRMSLRVNTSHLDTADERRAHRNKLGATLEEIWKRFQEEKLDFDTAFQRELRGIAEAAIESYLRDLQRQVDLRSGTPIDPVDLIPNSLSRLLRSAVRRFKEAGISAEDPMKRAVEFLYSEHGLNTPQNRLNAMLLAALARRATTGQKRVPDRGAPNDIDVIASYSPYCDAIFIDDEFAGLLREPPLATEMKKYGTLVFSTRTRGEFLAYLQQMEAELPPEHVERVMQTYGKSWLDGFRSILEKERERGTGGANSLPK